VERPDASFSATHFDGEREDWDGLNSGTPVDGNDAAWRALLTASDAGFEDDAAYLEAAGLGEGPQLIDTLDYADYMLTNLYVGNTDWPRKNFYVGRDRVRGVGFKFYMWDSEWSMGIQSNLDTDRTGVTEVVARPWAALKRNAEFRLLVADRAHRHLFPGGALYVNPEAPEWDPDHPEHNLPAARFVELAEGVALPLVAESARWGDQHQDRPYTVDEHWQAERDRLLAEYLPRRSEVFLDQLRRADLYPGIRGPLFEPRGGEVPRAFEVLVDAEGDRLLLTVDGSDPRLPGGEVGPTAMEHPLGAPFPLGEGPEVVLKARARAVDGTWSALEEALFVVEP